MDWPGSRGGMSWQGGGGRRGEDGRDGSEQRRREQGRADGTRATPAARVQASPQGAAGAGAGWARSGG